MTIDQYRADKKYHPCGRTACLAERVFDWHHLRILAALVLVVATARPAVANELLIADTLEGIVRLRDANGDGDALDAGEKALWYSPTSGLALTGQGRDVFLSDLGRGAIWRARDDNHDGDALDIGEAVVWADDSVLATVDDLASGWSGSVFATDSATSVWRFTDHNADGDALDAGEKSLFAAGFGTATDMAPIGGELLVLDSSVNQVFRLIDRNGDGDALDAAERLLQADFSQHAIVASLFAPSEQTLFASLPSPGQILLVHDVNSDGDMLDSAEVVVYADSVFGPLSGPAAMANAPGGGFFALNTYDGSVARIEDNNGDGDALDVGDARLYADGLAAPVDLLTIFDLSGDYNRDGVVNAADYTVWRDTLAQAGPGLPADGNGNHVIDEGDYDVWKLSFGAATAGAGQPGPRSDAIVPEPPGLLSLGMLILALTRKRRRAANASPRISS